MKNWNQVKTLVHDASGVTNPYEWAWKIMNGVYYPFTRVETKPERGAAEMRIELKEGLITIWHSNGEVLLHREAVEGDWDKIWKTLRNEK